MTLRDLPACSVGGIGRERWLVLRAVEAHVSEISLDPVKDGFLIFSQKMGKQYDGAMETDKMKLALADIFQFID